MRFSNLVKLRRIEGIDILVFVFLTIFALIVVYPFYNSILMSLVSVREYAQNPAMIWAKEITFENYKFIIENSNIPRGYLNTFIIVFAGVPYSLLLTTSMAYVFSRKQLRGKRILFLIALITMFFYGGLIPTYLNIKELGLINHRTAIILMYGINTYYMILIKNSFEQVPEALSEAAKIDGANDLTIFFRVMLPMVLPTMATFTLFIIVDYWNEWYFSMLLINDYAKMPLQVVLRTIVVDASLMRTMTSSLNKNVNSDGVKMASIVVTMLPVMLVYPFIQKFFIKGITVGAVKM